MTDEATTAENVFEALDLPHHAKAADIVKKQFGLFGFNLVLAPEKERAAVEVVAKALEEASEIATTAERERASSAVVAEAYWRHQGATPDRNTQTPAQIYAQDKAFERRCLLYMVGELGAEYEPLTQTQWMEIKRRATALIKGKMG